MAYSLYETCTFGIKVVVFIKINIQCKLINTTTMIPCRRVSYRELAFKSTFFMVSFSLLFISLRVYKLCSNNYSFQSQKKKIKAAKFLPRHFVGSISDAFSSPVYVPPREETARRVSGKVCL